MADTAPPLFQFTTQEDWYGAIPLLNADAGNAPLELAGRAFEMWITPATQGGSLVDPVKVLTMQTGGGLEFGGGGANTFVFRVAKSVAVAFPRGEFTADLLEVVDGERHLFMPVRIRYGEPSGILSFLSRAFAVTYAGARQPIVTSIGVPGRQGSPGATIITGSAPPAPADGRNGDYWIEDRSASGLGRRMYGPKAGGAWPGTPYPIQVARYQDVPGLTDVLAGKIGAASNDGGSLLANLSGGASTFQPVLLGDLGAAIGLNIARAGIAGARIFLRSIRVDGFATPGDGGQGAVYVRGDANGLMAIKDAAGTWWNLAPAGGVFNVRHFGAKGDGASGADGNGDTVAFQTASNAATLYGAQAYGERSAMLYAPFGHYAVRGFDLARSVGFFGDGSKSTAISSIGGSNRSTIRVMAYGTTTGDSIAQVYAYPILRGFFVNGFDKGQTGGPSYCLEFQDNPTAAYNGSGKLDDVVLIGGYSGGLYVGINRNWLVAHNVVSAYHSGPAGIFNGFDHRVNSCDFMGQIATASVALDIRTGGNSIFGGCNTYTGGTGFATVAISKYVSGFVDFVSCSLDDGDTAVLYVAAQDNGEARPIRLIGGLVDNTNRSNNGSSFIRLQGRADGDVQVFGTKFDTHGTNNPGASIFSATDPLTKVVMVSPYISPDAVSGGIGNVVVVNNPLGPLDVPGYVRATALGANAPVRAGTTAVAFVGGDVVLEGANRTLMGNLYYASGWKYGGAGTGSFAVFGASATNAFSVYAAANNTAGADAAATPVHAFTVGPDGNLGVKTTTPAYPLDVNGAARVVGALTTSGAVSSTATQNLGLISATWGTVYARSLLVRAGNGVDVLHDFDGGTARAQIQVYSSGTSTAVGSAFYDLLLNPKGGNVGVGTTGPGVKLDVAGLIRPGSYTVGTLPAGVVGGIITVTNARKVGEAAGSGTGVLAHYTNGAWRRLSDDTAVAA